MAFTACNCTYDQMVHKERHRPAQTLSHTSSFQKRAFRKYRKYPGVVHLNEVSLTNFCRCKDISFVVKLIIVVCVDGVLTMSTRTPLRMSLKQSVYVRVESLSYNNR